MSTRQIPFSSTDKLEIALYSYLRKEAPHLEVLALTKDRVNNLHRSGVGRHSRQYWVRNGGVESSIFVKQYHSIAYAKKEFNFLCELRTLFRIDKRVSIVEPLSRDNNVILFTGLSGTIGVDLFKPLLLGKSFLLARFFDVGRWLATFHNTKLRSTSCPKRSESYKHFLSMLLSNHINHFSGQYLNSDTQLNIKDTLSILIASSAREAEYGICHGDFCPENIVFEKDRGFCTVLDFEDFHYGFQVKDLAVFCAKLKLLELFFPRYSDLIDELERAFLRGYINIRGALEPNFKITRYIYLLRVASPLRFHRSLDLRLNMGSYIRRKRYERLLKNELVNISCTLPESNENYEGT